MELIKPKAELLIQGYTLNDIYKHIELCGRTCYKSEDRIKEGSAEKFIDMLVNNRHFAMFEHGTVYLRIPVDKYEHDYAHNPHSLTDNQFNKDTRGINVTTNLRVIHEYYWYDDLQYLCEPTIDHEKRYTVRITTNRAVSHQLVRHRTFSFAQESQRFINYAKKDSITFIEPAWYNDATNSMKEDFEKMLRQAENNYFLMSERGFKPQQARAVLPNATKTEIIMTGFVSDWERFFEMRLLERTGKVDPDMKTTAYRIFEALMPYIPQTFM